jgi:molybdopterin converting factor subunit 1
MKIKCFGVAREIVNDSILHIESEQLPTTVEELRKFLSTSYPEFKQYKSCMIAVNQAYANDDTELSAYDEIAIIPPVSGG